MNTFELRTLTKQLGGNVTRNGKYKTKQEMIEFIKKMQQSGGNKNKVTFKEEVEIIPIPSNVIDTYKGNLSQYAQVCINHLFKKYNIWEESDITLDFPVSYLDLLMACLKAIDNKSLTETEKNLIMDHYIREIAHLKKFRKVKI